MGACARNMYSDPAQIKPAECCIKLVFHLTLTVIVADSVESDKEVEGLYLEKGTAEEDETESWNETTNCQRFAGCEQCYCKAEGNI